MHLMQDIQPIHRYFAQLSQNTIINHIKIQGLFKHFQGPWILKTKFKHFQGFLKSTMG